MDSNPVALRRPHSLLEAVEWGRDAGQLGPYLREFLDEFYVASDDRRAAMIAEAPPPTDPRNDAYVAATAEHLAQVYGLAVPRWTWMKERFLTRPFFPAGLESLKATYLVSSPPAFRRRMIFVESDPLSRPRRGT